MLVGCILGFVACDCVWAGVQQFKWLYYEDSFMCVLFGCFVGVLRYSMTASIFRPQLLFKGIPELMQWGKGDEDFWHTFIWILVLTPLSYILVYKSRFSWMKRFFPRGGQLSSLLWKYFALEEIIQICLWQQQLSPPCLVFIITPPSR